MINGLCFYMPFAVVVCIFVVTVFGGTCVLYYHYNRVG